MSGNSNKKVLGERVIPLGEEDTRRVIPPTLEDLRRETETDWTDPTNVSQSHSGETIRPPPGTPHRVGNTQSY